MQARSNRPPAVRIAAQAWASGYQHTACMTVSSGGLMEPLRVMFRSICWLHGREEPRRAAAVVNVTAFAVRIEPLWDTATTRIATQGVRRIGWFVQTLDGGNLRTCCFYIFLALAVLAVLLLTLAW